MIEIRHVTKIYPQAKGKALDDVSLAISSGEFFGLLGPNGAGKTTLISILATLLLPTEGEITIDGEKLTRRRGDIKRKLSLITQHNSLRSDMTLDQIMELQGRLYAMTNPGEGRGPALLLRPGGAPEKDRAQAFRRHEAETDAVQGAADGAGDSDPG